MIRIPVCFSSKILGRGDKEKDHGPCVYCRSFSCLALTLAAGAGPGPRRAIRRPYPFKPDDKLRGTNRTPGTFCAPKGSKGLISILQKQVRKGGHAVEHWTDCRQAIIFPRQVGSYARPTPNLPHSRPSLLARDSG